MNKNIVWHQANITKTDRQNLNNQKSVIVWFTGLSASGKSSLAHAVDEALYKRKIRSYVLDGDNIRHGLNRDLGFSDTDYYGSYETQDLVDTITDKLLRSITP